MRVYNDLLTISINTPIRILKTQILCNISRTKMSHRTDFKKRFKTVQINKNNES